MSTTYICTQGTSIANPLGQVLRDRQARNNPWETPDDSFRDQLLRLFVGRTFSAACSAETTVLDKAHVGPSDRVVLLATDTALGRICSDVLRREISRGFGLPTESVEIRRIVGLQVGDSEKLRRTGVRALLSEVHRCASATKARGDGVALCPNGGYKGVVPFLTLMGTVLRCPVLYTFELSHALIRLPWLPLSVDRDAYARARDALIELNHQTELPEARYLKLVEDYHEDERDLFLGFTEETRPGFVTTSPLFDVFIEQSVTISSAPLSSAARKDWDNLSPSMRPAFKKLMLAAQDPIWISAKRHSLETTDLLAIKTSRTSERLLGYESDGSFRVCRLLVHDDYKRKMSCYSKADFPDGDFQVMTFD